MRSTRFICGLAVVVNGLFCSIVVGQDAPDTVRQFQFRAVELKQADWIHWGDRQSTFSNWTNHSNRLIPVYSFGVSLDSIQGDNSCYRDAEKLEQLYGQMPMSTLHPKAEYFDQTDIYHLQKKAWESGKKNVILMVFDGMDWDTTRAASIYKNKKVLYTKGRGQGLSFLDYKKGESDFGFCVTSPHSGATKFDVDTQVVTENNSDKGGGYSGEFGGMTPWQAPGDPSYLLSKRKTVPHPYADSAATATSLNAGKKTYNSSINVDPDGQQFVTLAHQMQRKGYAVGVVTNVPISHATPACVYAHNVNRSDYQDITRDMLGLNSISHRSDPLPGVDVLIGCGWGEMKEDDRVKQGQNFVPGNTYLTESDLKRSDEANGGRYVIAQRTSGKSGKQVLKAGVDQAIAKQKRFFGFFGTSGGHLPYRTADGNYDPTRGISRVDVYTPEDVTENPKLADMTESALQLLGQNKKGFYLMVEAGDVDWANHNNNIDDSIGAVLSGEAAFDAITNWVEANSNWDETCLIVTADHGHMMVLDDPSALTGEKKPLADAEFARLRKLKQKSDAEMARLEAEANKKALEEKAAGSK